MTRSIPRAAFWLILCLTASIFGRPFEKIRKDALTVGIQPGASPFGLIDAPEGKGIEYDIISSIASRLGLHFRLVRLGSLNEGENLLASDRIDVIISHVKATPQLHERFLLSSSYYKTGLGTLTLKSNQSIFTISDLNNHAVAITPESGAETLLSSFAPKAKPEMVHSVAEALSLLEKGDVEAVIHDNPILMAEQSKNPGLRLLDVNFTEDNYVLLCNRKSSSLMAALNIELTKLRTATAQAPDPLSVICSRYKIPSTIKPICNNCNAPPTSSPVTMTSSTTSKSNEELIDSLLRQVQEMEATLLRLKRVQK